jgi:uncharacterized membrane protein
MGAGHSHSLGADGGTTSIAAHARPIILVILVMVALATAVGLVRLWPDQASVRAATHDAQFAAPGVTFPHAKVTHVQRPCKLSDMQEAPRGAPTCGQVDATVRTGPDRAQRISVQLSGPSGTQGLIPGDSIQVMHVPLTEGAPASSAYSYFGVDRARSLSYLVGFFILIVVLVARLRGLMALIGLVFAGGVVGKFMLPALISGEPGLWVALTSSATIMFVVLYAAHGISMRTSTALAGTLVGVAITAGIAHIAIGANRLSGMGDESGSFLSGMVNHLDFRGLLICAVIVAGLGVLNDVTITQASAVWELRAAGPELSRRRLFASAMRIGRDHIASTIYTIVFAYAGAALSVLLLIYLYDRPMLDLLGTEDIADEVVRTLCSAVGLVLAVPVTTAIAALFVSGPVTSPRGDATEESLARRSLRTRGAV